MINFDSEVILSKEEMTIISGGRHRHRVVSTKDTDGDGRWDIKIVQVFVDGILIRSRTRFR